MENILPGYGSMSSYWASSPKHKYCKLWESKYLNTQENEPNKQVAKVGNTVTQMLTYGDFSVVVSFSQKLGQDSFDKSS